MVNGLNKSGIWEKLIYFDFVKDIDSIETKLEKILSEVSDLRKDIIVLKTKTLISEPSIIPSGELSYE